VPAARRARGNVGCAAVTRGGDNGEIVMDDHAYNSIGNKRPCALCKQILCTVVPLVQLIYPRPAVPFHVHCGRAIHAASPQPVRPARGKLLPQILAAADSATISDRSAPKPPQLSAGTRRTPDAAIIQLWSPLIRLPAASRTSPDSALAFVVFLLLRSRSPACINMPRIRCPSPAETAATGPSCSLSCIV
jgi:hypothetical protein